MRRIAVLAVLSMLSSLVAGPPVLSTHTPSGSPSMHFVVQGAEVPHAGAVRVGDSVDFKAQGLPANTEAIVEIEEGPGSGTYVKVLDIIPYYSLTTDGNGKLGGYIQVPVAETGDYLVRVSAGGVKTSSGKLTVVPKVSVFPPAGGAVGTWRLIEGSGFKKNSAIIVGAGAAQAEVDSVAEIVAAAIATVPSTFTSDAWGSFSLVRFQVAAGKGVINATDGTNVAATPALIATTAITPPAEAKSIQLVGTWPYGSPLTVTAGEIAGKPYSFLALGRAVVGLDMSQPAQPVKVGEVVAPERVLGLSLRGNLLFMASFETGLRVLDVSSPTTPREVGFYDTPGTSPGLFVLGNLAYVADGPAGLRVVDISDATAPKEVGFYDTPGYSRGVFVSGSLAYVADGWMGLRVVDVSNPTAPREVSFYDTPGEAIKVFVSGNLAYLADGDMGLKVLDVSQPATPREVSSYRLTPLRGVHDVFVSENLAYVAYGQEGLRVVDVSNPATPAEVSFFNFPSSATAVFVLGNLAYVVDSFKGLRVVDVSSPTTPREVGFFSAPYSANGVFISGKLAFVADGGGGLRIVDVSNPSSLREVGFYYKYAPPWTWTPTGQRPGVEVFVSGNLAFLAEENGGLRVIDVSDPTTPREVGYYDSPGTAQGVFVSGNFAYVADGPGGLMVVDISDPTAPKEVGFYDTPGTAHGVFVSGNYAYVADGWAGLRAVDVSNPTAPKETGFQDTPGTAYGVSVWGNRAYVADGDKGLRVMDITFFTPWEVGFYDTPGTALGVFATGAEVYVADGKGLRVVNVINSASPRETGLYEATRAVAVVVAGNLAFVAGWGAGLTVLKYTPPVSVSGRIQLEGRTQHGGIRLVFQGDATSDETSTTPDGRFYLSLSPGSYTVRAEKEGFLPASRAIEVFRWGLALPPVVLRMGDVNGDGVIDLKDLSVVGRNFGMSQSPWE